MTPLRVGVIGAGAIAQTAHLPVLAKMRGVELVAICDNDRVKARSIADRFDITFEATRGGKATLYPEYMKTIEELRKQEAAAGGSR